MRTLTVHAADLQLGGEPIADSDGALLYFVAVEPGDSASAGPIATRAAADLDRIAADLGADAVAIVPLTTGDLGPAAHRDPLASDPTPLPDAIQEHLSTSAVLVGREEYPTLSVSGTLHPTAVRIRRYDGRSNPGPSPPGDGDSHAGSQATTPGYDPATLRTAGVLDDDGTWTPGALFLRDELLGRIRQRATDRGAVVRAGRADGLVTTTDATLGVRRTALGPQPELSTVVDHHDDAVDAIGRWLPLAVEVLDPLFDLRGVVSGTDDTTASRLGLGSEAVQTIDRADESADRIAVMLRPAEADRPVAWATTRAVDGGLLVQCAPIGRFGGTAGAAFATDRPVIPTDLSPTTLRLVPIDERHVPTALDRAERIGGRVDVDDRDLPVGDRIATLRAEGVPWYAILGDREQDRTDVPLASRERRTQRWRSIESVAPLVDGGPRGRYGPLKLSSRRSAD